MENVTALNFTPAPTEQSPSGAHRARSPPCSRSSGADPRPPCSFLHDGHSRTSRTGEIFASPGNPAQDTVVPASKSTGIARRHGPHLAQRALAEVTTWHRLAVAREAARRRRTPHRHPARAAPAVSMRPRQPSVRGTLRPKSARGRVSHTRSCSLRALADDREHVLCVLSPRSGHSVQYAQPIVAGWGHQVIRPWCF